MINRRVLWLLQVVLGHIDLIMLIIYVVFHFFLVARTINVYELQLFKWLDLFIEKMSCYKFPQYFDLLIILFGWFLAWKKTSENYLVCFDIIFAWGIWPSSIGLMGCSCWRRSNKSPSSGCLIDENWEWWWRRGIRWWSD